MKARFFNIINGEAGKDRGVKVRFCDGSRPWEFEIITFQDRKNEDTYQGIVIDYESMKKFVEKVERKRAKSVA